MKLFIKKNISFVIIALLTLLYIPNVTAQVITQDITHFDDDPYNLNSIASNGNINVAVGSSGNIFTSLNGKKWIKSNFVAKHYLNFVMWIKNKFIAVGKKGELLTSPNGLVWSENSLNADNELLKIVCINNTYIIITNNYNLNSSCKIFVSDDAIKWNPANLVLYNYGNKQAIIKNKKLNINDITFYNHKYMAIFQDNSSLDGITYIGSSNDLKNWDCQPQQCRMYSLSTNGKILLAVGSIIKSTSDGIKWKNIKDLKNMFGKGCNTYCSYIRWVNNKFIAVGLSKDSYYSYNVFCLTSLNSSNWKLNTCDDSITSTGYVRITGFDSNKNNFLFSAKQSDNTHMTLGWIFDINNNGISMISDDDNIIKLSFQTIYSGPNGYNDIIYNGKYFISVGDDEHITIVSNK